MARFARNSNTSNIGGIGAITCRFDTISLLQASLFGQEADRWEMSRLSPNFKTDARGITINYSPSDAPIDGLHRVLKKTYSNGDTPVTYTYDQGTNANGRLSSEALGSITRSFSYDPLGRVVGQTDCLPSGCHTTSVPVTQSGEGYNLASELVSLNYPDGRNVTSSFNAAGRITSVNLAAFNGTAVNLEIRGQTGRFLIFSRP